ncbi:MAG: PIN domain-containing protein [Actinobacteria bacterium]|nr:PIN domain-containing protein [Actinomycetota bacterium]
MLIVDTGVLVAAADESDRRHADCAAVLAGDGPFVTTAMVIAETAYLLERELGPVAEAALYTTIVDGDLRIETLALHDWARIRELIETYANLALGGTDASLIAIAERLDVTDIATLDARHFRIVRPAHRDAFDLVP